MRRTTNARMKHVFKLTISLLRLSDKRVLARLELGTRPVQMSRNTSERRTASRIPKTAVLRHDGAYPAGGQ